MPPSGACGQSLPRSGPLGERGGEYRDGALAYFKWINSKGGVHGRRIELLSLDDGAGVEKTVANARRLLDQEGVLAFFGMAGTANYAALLPLIAERQVVSLAPYTGSDELRRANSPYTFWLRASYSDEAEQIVDQLTTIGIHRIAVFYQDDAFGRDAMAGVDRALEKIGLKIHAAASYDRNNGEVGAAVKAIAAAQPQAVVMISTDAPTAAFVRQLRRTGQRPQLFALSETSHRRLQADLGSESAGIAFSQVVPHPGRGGIAAARESDSLPKEFLPPGGMTYTRFEGYLAAKVMVEALRRAGPQPTREKLLAALESMKPYDAGGFSVSFGRRERLGSRYVDIAIVGSNGLLMR